MELGAAVPGPPMGFPAELQDNRHQLRAGVNVIARPIFGGLHHDYALVAA